MRGDRMVSFVSHSLRVEFQRVQGLVGRLLEAEKIVNWNKFRPIVAKLYRDNTEIGGRPHTDEVVLVKCLVLQSWYDLSDQELEAQIADRLSFRQFLDFPETVPDYSTIWAFRERLTQNGLDKIWAELQRQLDAHGCTITKGTIQDASIITADVGKKRQYLEKKARKQGKKNQVHSKTKSPPRPRWLIHRQKRTSRLRVQATPKR